MPRESRCGPRERIGTSQTCLQKGFFCTDPTRLRVLSPFSLVSVKQPPGQAMASVGWPVATWPGGWPRPPQQRSKDSALIQSTWHSRTKFFLLPITRWDPRGPFSDWSVLHCSENNLFSHTNIPWLTSVLTVCLPADGLGEENTEGRLHSSQKCKAPRTRSSTSQVAEVWQTQPPPF